MASVFGILDNVKRSFMSARGDVGLQDVRFHDLRHTAATRLVGAHGSWPRLGPHSGEYDLSLCQRKPGETARRAAAALNMFNSEGTAEPESAEMVN
jgi:hypothetical protein